MTIHIGIQELLLMALAFGAGYVYGSHWEFPSRPKKVVEETYAIPKRGKKSS